MAENVVYEALVSPVVKSIFDKIQDLPKSARFRAFNSRRSLEWAGKIYDLGLHIPATYCALHATEEAVAAIVSCAKECGYEGAKDINIRDHRAKAIVSIVAQKVQNSLVEHGLKVGKETVNGRIGMKVVNGDGHEVTCEATTLIAKFVNADGVDGDDFYDYIVSSMSDFSALSKAVYHAQEARNGIFYASKKGYPTGFNDPVESLRRESGISIALIWAAQDIIRNKGVKIPVIQQSIRTINEIYRMTAGKKAIT